MIPVPKPSLRKRSLTQHYIQLRVTALEDPLEAKPRSHPGWRSPGWYKSWHLLSTHCPCPCTMHYPKPLTCTLSLILALLMRLQDFLGEYCAWDNILRLQISAVGCPPLPTYTFFCLLSFCLIHARSILHLFPQEKNGAWGMMENKYVYLTFASKLLLK